jgi:ectoine hydroxylase-related dioxygenase (phytanoyl-CoA dioxygenase family)
MMQDLFGRVQESVFSSQGYVHIPAALPPALLQSLQNLFDDLMPQEPATGNFLTYENKEKTYITNIDKLCNRGDLSCLELLGQPLIKTIAQRLCGDAFVPVQDFAVIKNQGDGMPILCHRDLEYQPLPYYINIGIYLDDADALEGALQIIPGSHASGASICEVQQWPAQALAAKAGDIIVHDMRLAHQSGPLLQNKIRRVIYFECMPGDEVLTQTLYSEEVLALRRELYQCAQDYVQAKQNQSIAILKQTLERIYAPPVKGHVSVYCFE